MLSARVFRVSLAWQLRLFLLQVIGQQVSALADHVRSVWEQAMGNIHGILPEGKVVTGVEVRASCL